MLMLMLLGLRSLVDCFLLDVAPLGLLYVVFWLLPMLASLGPKGFIAFAAFALT